MAILLRVRYSPSKDAVLQAARRLAHRQERLVLTEPATTRLTQLLSPPETNLLPEGAYTESAHVTPARPLVLGPLREPAVARATLPVTLAGFELTSGTIPATRWRR